MGTRRLETICKHSDLIEQRKGMSHEAIKQMEGMSDETIKPMERKSDEAKH
jgi:hypothetical protein